MSLGRLPKLWRTLRRDNEGRVVRRSGDNRVEKRRTLGGVKARDIRCLVTLDDSVQSVDLLFWCIYECRYDCLLSYPG